MTVALVAMLLLGLACALAEGGDGRAATAAEQTALLSLPRAGAQELMVYDRGVRVEIVREVDAAYVQVNVGAQGGSLTGYMRRDDLVLGEAAVRGVWPEVHFYVTDGRPCRLYGYTDERAPVLIEECLIDGARVIGQGDGWLHMEIGVGQTGFVRRADIAITQEHRSTQPYIDAIPMAGELSEADAIVYAKARLLADAQRGVNLYMGMGELTEEALDACRADVRVLLYDSNPGVLEYVITFYDPQTGGNHAWLNLRVKGEEILECNYGNG